MIKSHIFETKTIQIQDDFHLKKIADSGQCFRVRPFLDGTYRFITGDKIAYIKHLEKDTYSICCTKDSWQDIWNIYFDFSRNYKTMREGITATNDFIANSIEAGVGIRLLRQNPWEMLITFIISQRKSIPAISKAVENLAVKYGEKIVTDYETVYTFPTPEKLCQASEEELNACGLGYRLPYVRDAARKVMTKNIDLDAMDTYTDTALFEELLKVRGVGKKVANCVCLYGYGRTASVPIDVWIERAIAQECGGKNPFCGFGEEAGIVQQYVFYYERNYLVHRKLSFG